MAEVKKFDRSKFKDTVTAEQLEAQDKAVDAAAGKVYDNNYAPWHKIEDGVNKFRLYPAHPNEKGHSFVVPVQRWWLSVEVEERDDNNKVIMEGRSPKMKIVRKRVFDGRVHSKIGKDVVNEYIEFLTKTLKSDGLDEAAVTEKLLPIYGRYSPVPAQRVNGITGKPEWVMYAEKVHGDVRTFGKLPIGKAVKIRLNDLIARESADEPIGSEATNPFTDPDDGRLLEITYNSKATKAADYYKSEIDSSYDKETKMIKLMPLSDDDLGKFMEFDSLHEQYVDCYTTRDFSLAMEGLKNLDTENDFGVFQHEAFLDICEELSKAYPEPKKKDEAEAKEEVEEEVSEFDFDKMERNALKIFNRDNKCGIAVTKSMSDDDLREALYSWLDSAEKEVEGNETVEEPEEDVEEAVEEAVAEEVEEEVDDLPFDVKERGSATKPETKEEEVEEAPAKEISTADRIKALRDKQAKDKDK